MQKELKMYYKIDLNNYEPRKVPDYQKFTNYNDIKWEQIEMISKELDNFKDSFGKDWQEWTLYDLRDRLQDNWSFYLVEGGWAFIDYNWEIPKLCNRYVFPNNRDGKLGEDLVWMRFNDLKEQGYDYCFGFVDNWNKPAQVVSRKFKGFVETYESLDIKKK